MPARPIHTNPAMVEKRIKRASVSKASLRALETGSFEAVLETLTPMQVLFCENMLLYAVPTDAAIKAGYGEKNAKKQGYQLMESPAIRFIIDEMRAERAKGSDITKDSVLKDIAEIVAKAKQEGNHNASLRGLELLAKHLGMFVERREISGPDGEAIRMEQKVKQDVADFTSRLARLAAVDGQVVPLRKEDNG